MTDITYIRTLEGFAYLAVVIDLYSRRVIGWSVQGRQTTDVALQALLMAVWRRKPKNKVLVHSDQGSQFTSMDWAAFLRDHNLEHSPLVDASIECRATYEPTRELPRQCCGREFLQPA